MIKRTTKKTTQQLKLDKEFLRVAENILRKNRELLEKLAKI